jgi:hypothetical protein
MSDGEATPSRPMMAYIELAVRDVAASRDFFARAFGWTMQDYGPGYAGSLDSGTELGLHGDDDGAGTSRAPLPGIRVGDLEAAEQAVRAAGGEIIVPVFAFPGGRRFQFREPSGNELVVFVYEDEGTANA